MDAGCPIQEWLDFLWFEEVVVIKNLMTVPDAIAEGQRPAIESGWNQEAGVGNWYTKQICHPEAEE